MNLCNSSYNLWMREISVSPNQVAMTRVSSGANVFHTQWQCVALLKFIISSRGKSAVRTLVDKIVFILYAKFLSSSANHATQSLPRWNLYIHNESSYEQDIIC